MQSIHLVPRNDHLIQEAYEDFILSRKASLLSSATIDFYEYTVGGFIAKLDIRSPDEITAILVREHITSVNLRGVASATVHCHARGIRAFVRFLFAEGYMTSLMPTTMPRVEEKPMRVLDQTELQSFLRACKRPRDRALVLFLVDTGLRRSEAISLNWLDIDLKTGVVNVLRNKNKKPRSVFVGVLTRRTLLRYRRGVSHKDTDPVWQTLQGTRLKANGLRQILRRVGERAEIKFSAHDLRRAAETMMLRAGASAFHQGGHALRVIQADK